MLTVGAIIAALVGTIISLFIQKPIEAWQIAVART